jgi:branched-chain amino acid transport system permease protein
MNIDRHEIATASIKVGRGVLLPARLAVLVLLSAAVVLWALGETASVRYAIIMGFVYAIAILGNNAIFATLGEMSLGISAMMALGAYAVAYALNHGFSLPVSVLISVAVTTVVGAALAVPTVRLTGIFTALATFALAFAIPSLAVYLEKLTGGAEGAALPIDPTFLGFIVGGASPGMLVVCAIAFVVFGALSALLLNRSPGRIALLVGEAAPAASVFGVRVTLVQIAVWTWAAMLGGIAGVLFGLTVGFVSPTQFDAFVSIAVVTGGIIGGVRSAPGALIGGLLVGALPSQLQTVMPAAGTGILFGAILFAALLFRGRGIAEAVERLVLYCVRRFAAGSAGDSK